LAKSETHDVPVQKKLKIRCINSSNLAENLQKYAFNLKKSVKFTFLAKRINKIHVFLEKI
jgi:hypothetical protein